MNKLNRISIVIAFLILMISNVFAKRQTISLAGNQYLEIIVGTKQSDSSGQLQITNSTIQASIISQIPSISSMTIKSTTAVISISGDFCYLIFSVNNINGENLNVAVELTLNGNELRFRSGSKEVHTCKGFGTCTACNFTKDRNKKISGCSCSATSGGALVNPPQASGCIHGISLGL